MPETQTANAEVQKFQEQLEGDSQAMQEEYMTKMQNAQSNMDTWTQLRLQKEQEELEEWGSVLCNSTKVYIQQELQRKQMDLMLPIIEKAQEAINTVAKSNSFTYILDSSTGKL